VTSIESPAPADLPTSPDAWAPWLRSRVEDNLAEAKRLREQIKTDPPPTAIDVLELWNDLHVALGNAYGSAGLLQQVHPDQSIRTQSEAAEQDLHRFSTDLGMDREVYDVLAGLDATTVDADAARLLHLSLRDFRRAGVDRDEQTRARLTTLNEKETLLAQEFSKNIRDDVRVTRLAPARLAGLPQDYVDRHPVGDDGLVEITTDYPDTVPFLHFAHDREARTEVMLAFNNRAWPQNDSVLRELLALRDEHARLLGYASWPDYDAEVKMIGKGTAIGEFITEIAEVSETSGRRDIAVLTERLRQDHPDAEVLTRADSNYYSEVISKEQYDVDAQVVRTYFDFPKVRRGLLDVTGRLFGVTYEPVVDAPVWHEDVATYDVMSDGRRIGRIHLDLHPREGKYKHAAQFDLVSGVAGRQLPEGVLVCNFPRGLMEHTDVVTLFHEFGHLVHHVLGGNQRWARFSGVATEWDFVEAPSQMLEEWAWDATVLQTFATNADDEPIPAELVAKMRAADDFGKGYQARTQMAYAAISYQLHRQLTDDISTLVRELQTTYDLVAPLDGSHFHASFGHLTGYTSGYYTYMWSLVIAKDLFSAFDGDDLFAHETASRYRDLVLAQGGRKDAADLVADFLGRPYDAAAFRRWLDR
jgi:thimet oligopeptidase